MGVYKTKSVYKTPSVYRSGVYKKDSSESVLLNGVRYENSFYEIDSENVGSTFVDAVQLPSGYEKLGRVWNGNTNYDGPSTLISTTYQIPELFGDVYLGFWNVSQTVYYTRVFSNVYTDENTRYTRVQNSTTVNSYIWNVNSNGPRSSISPRTASCQLNDTNKFKTSLLSNGTWVNGKNQEGTFAEDRHIALLSGKALTYFRFAFVADRNRQVTFTAIPCRHGSDYGLYDVVAGKFYTHPDLIGSVTVTIGDKTYKTVKIGNQVWMAENLDFVFDGLTVGQGSSSSEPRANYYNNDEATYGWGGTKYGLLYNWIAVKYLEDHKSELIPGWHVPTASELDALATAVGGSSVAGTKLKSTTGWSSGNGDGSYGFEAFPAGYQSSGSFNSLGSYAGFWTATEYSSSEAYNRHFDTGASMNSGYRNKSRGYSVRLVKDSPVSLLGSSNVEAADVE